MLAAIFQRALLRPVRLNVHAIEHPSVRVIQRAAAQSHGVHLQPARALFLPDSADGNALTQQTAWPRAAASAQVHAQRRDEPVERARAGRQHRPAQIGIEPAMILFKRRQPFGQERVQA